MMRLLERHSCPVRLAEVDDLVARGRNDSDRWTRKGVCSHCGSLRPQRFIEMIKAGMLVTVDEGSADACVFDPAGRLAGKMDFSHLSHAERDEIRFLEISQRVNMGRANHWF
jgi:hypothetical protein